MAHEVTPGISRWLERELGTSLIVAKHSFSNQDDVYRVQAKAKTYYLKVADSLQAEHNNAQKLAPYITVPKIAAFERLGDQDCLLMSALPGKNLIEWHDAWSAEQLVREFAAAVRTFHRALPLRDIFPDAPVTQVVLHGDMAMPNILCAKPGNWGYIDLAQLKPGTVDQDLADALWSVQYNLGPGYGELFLHSYGEVEMTDHLRKALDFRYNP